MIIKEDFKTIDLLDEQGNEKVKSCPTDCPAILFQI